MQPQAGLLWLFVGAGIALGANAIAVIVSSRTFGAMGGTSEFALAARRHDTSVVPFYNAVVFPLATLLITVYLWPIGVYIRGCTTAAPTALVQRRIISLPLFVATLGLGAWVLGCAVFPALTVWHFGVWSRELISPQILSPLVSGFLAATTTYFLLDWLVRARIAPRLFPHGGLAQVPGAFALGVQARLLVFLLAVAFIPLFTMLGLVRAAVVRIEGGVPLDLVIPVLSHASGVTFVVYVLLGVGLTLVLARVFTRPLADVAAALRRVQVGDLDAGVRVTSSDEVGVLEDGVNAMVATLRDKQRILQTFGRVVEPSVRDQLLSGDLRLGGELRAASVLFCDLRGFTTLAERSPPEEIVATLNEFFTAMTAWVRQSGGFVDKFIGDAVMVVFGLFDSPGDGARVESAAAAVRCALGVRDRLGELNVRRAAAGKPALAVAVSVHSGDVLAGRIGAEDRHEYTVIGDTVNVAARLQELCKEWGHDLVVSETTYALANQCGVAGGVALREPVTLRGRNEPVRVFRIP
jgi:adenylate cyclase